MHVGVGVYLSNATGYVAGIIFSFVMNAKFTFSTTLSPLRFIKFVSTCVFLLHFKFNSNESFFHCHT
ncbi:GtrA family protein [Klebsiella michiganensis]|uniref:GtrA family protein n=1 Tax=Klebsiella michiganensis TaxID=1134687 RepID=UPI002265B40E|nr:GtrA family protein [Klebsiella michiganensis]